MHGALGASSFPSKLIKHVCNFVLSLSSFYQIHIRHTLIIPLHFCKWPSLTSGGTTLWRYAGISGTKLLSPVSCEVGLSLNSVEIPVDNH